MKKLLFVSVFSLLAVAAGAALFPLNSKLPYTVGVDTDGRNRFLGTIADLQIELGGKVFHRGPAQVGDRLAEKPTAADLERPLKFSCRFTTRETKKPQRLLDNAHAGAADGIMFDICSGRLRFMPGNDHAHLYHPTPIPSNREVEVSVEVTADHKVMMSVDGDRRLCGQLVDGRLVQELSGFVSDEPDTILSLVAPVEYWDEALPLGNGGAGALVWGKDNELRLTLDRADYWHNSRTEIFFGPGFNVRTLLDCVKTRDDRRHNAIFNSRKNCPTKLPGVRLTLTLNPESVLRKFRLDKSGTAHVTVATPAGEREILCWFDDGDDFLSLRLPEGVTLAKKEFNRNPSFEKLGGYPDPVIKIDEHGAFYSRGRRAGATSPFDHDFRHGVKFVDRGAAPKSAFWKQFNATSSISVPDASLQHLYDFAIYMYGASGRRGCAPMALQGLWTADNNALPPWDGDYHNDMNTEMTYWAAGPAGCIEALEGFADFYLERIESFRAFARKIYECQDGAVITPTMGYTGEMIAGWTAYEILPEHGLWAYNTFVNAFDYAPTREKAARYLAFGRELAAAMEHAWTVKDGVRTLILSSSPEVDDNRLSCFFTTNTNYARSILNAFYIRLARLAAFLGEREEAAKWRSYVGTFGPVSARNGVLEIAKGRLLTYSHRHASHLMDVFPFYDTPRDAEVDPVKSVDQFERLSSRHWVGFSFSWEGCLNARLGRGDRAWMYLKEFQTLCASRNGFNLNNQIPAGPILHTGRPFTLDANFGFARAVQEMLLQHDPHTNTVTLFPALPKHWDGKEVTFRDLRISGGHRLTATRAANGRVTYHLTPYPGSPLPKVRAN